MYISIGVIFQNLTDYYDSTSYGGEVDGILTQQSPFDFLNAYVNLLNASLTVHKGLLDEKIRKEEIISSFLKHESVLTYIENFVSRKETSTNWFSKIEISFIYKIVLLDYFHLQSYQESLLWKIAISLIRHLQKGQEYQLSFLLNHIIFSSKYINTVQEITAGLSELSIKSDCPVNSSLGNYNAPNLEQNLDLHLPKLLKLYHGLLLTNSKTIEQSQIFYHHLCYSTPTLTLKTNGETVLPTDWQYLPLLTILHHRQTNANVNSNASIDRSSDEKEIEYVQDCLFWVYITTIRNIGTQALSSASAVLRLSRLSTVFLAAPDLFMEPKIHLLIQKCLYDTLLRVCSKSEEGIKFPNKKVPGIDSFKEYYEELINQFESVSYGNQLFATFLLLPLTAINTWEYRR